MDTEARTYSEYVVTVRVVQVVELEQGVLRKLLLSDHCFGFANGEDRPSWEKDLDYGRAYHGLQWRCLAKSDETATVAGSPQVFSAEQLADFVVPARLCSWRSDLVFDPNVIQWLLVHEATVSISEDDLRSKIAVEPDGVERTLFPGVRQLFVADNSQANQSRVSFVVEAEKAAKHVIADALSGGGISVAPEDISYPPNCGNATLFFVPSSIDDEGFLSPQSLSDEIMDYGLACERITAVKEERIRSKDLCYQFEGRYHIVIADSVQKCDSYMPFQFHAQFMWAYLRTMHSVVCEVEEACVRSTFKKGFEEHIDAVINSIQYVSFLNSEFVRSSQSRQEILRLIEKRWSLSSSLSQLRQFAEHLSGYLERSFQRKSAETGKRQETALFVLSFLQVVALFSVWSDYLGLVGSEQAASFDRLPFSLFGSNDVLYCFNLILPIVLILVSIGIIVRCILKSRS